MILFASVLCLIITSSSCIRVKPDAPETVSPTEIENPTEVESPSEILSPPVDVSTPVDESPRVDVDQPEPEDLDQPDSGVYKLPPFPKEATCKYFVSCDYFPTQPLCAKPKNPRGDAYTFANSCYLEQYNCEHESNQYDQSSDDEC